MLISTQNKLCSTETYPNKLVADGWINFAETRTSAMSGFLSEMVTKDSPGVYLGDNTILMLHVVDSCLAWRLIQKVLYLGTYWRVHSIKFCVPQAASPVGNYIAYFTEYTTTGIVWYPWTVTGVWANTQYSVS